MKKTNNDFTVFTHYVRGVYTAGQVIRYDQSRQFSGEAKMRFNKLMFECREFLRQLQKGLGPEMAEQEEEMNEELFALIWNIFNLDPSERSAYLNHVSEFESTEKIPSIEN
jgi:hypothetical protein